MNKIRHKFNYSIKNRMLTTFLLLILIPSAIFLIYCIKSYSNYALKAIISENYTVMDEINKRISSELNNYNSQILTLYYTEETKKYIDNENYNQESEYLKQFLASIDNSDIYINSIILELGERRYNVGYEYTNIDKYFAEHRAEVIKKKGKAVWIPTEKIPSTKSTNTKHFVYARAINSDKHTNVGILWVFFSDSFFSKALNNDIIRSSNQYFIVAPDQTIITSNNKKEIGTVSDAPYLSQVIAQQDGYIISYNKETKEKEIVVFATASDTGWTIVTVTGEDIIFKDLQSIKLMAVVIFLCYLIFIFFAYLLFSRLIFKPLERLSKNMNQITDGKFDVKLPVTSNDEIGMLTASYNYMIDEIKELMNSIRLEEQVKNEERLKILAMQISPHFIYNTLNTVKWMAVVNKQSNIAKMIEAMVKLMQTVTYYDNEVIPIEKEIDLVKNYIYIQKARYMNFDVNYDILEELYPYRINKLILQPIVENSILYAFRDKTEMGSINISAKISDALYITIADNGIGFDTKLLYQKKAKENKPGHIGIKNVQERIQMNYGLDYGLTIHSEINVGTEIVMRLPILEKEGDKPHD